MNGQAKEDLELMLTRARSERLRIDKEMRELEHAVWELQQKGLIGPLRLVSK